MFGRTVSLQLKPNSVAEFIQIIEKDIIPLLRKQPGFQDEIVFVVPGGTAAVAISVSSFRTQEGRKGLNTETRRHGDRRSERDHWQCRRGEAAPSAAPAAGTAPAGGMAAPREQKGHRRIVGARRFLPALGISVWLLLALTWLTSAGDFLAGS